MISILFFFLEFLKRLRIFFGEKWSINHLSRKIGFIMYNIIDVSLYEIFLRIVNIPFELILTFVGIQHARI